MHVEGKTVGMRGSMAAPPETYRTRRAKLAEELPRPMVILAGQARARQYATNTYPFRAGSNYLYFGGPPVPGAALLIDPGSDGDEGCTLVRAVMDFEEAVWIGEPPSDEHLASAAGIRQSALIVPDEVSVRLAGRLASFVGPPCRRRSTGALHTNGFGSSLWASINSWIAANNSLTFLKLPRRIRLSVILPNQRSTRFNQEELAGMK